MNERVRFLKGKKKPDTHFKGVVWDEAERRWRARAVVDGKTISLGLFDNDVDAAKMYDYWARKARKTVAEVNFPEPGKDRPVPAPKRQPDLSFGVPEIEFDNSLLRGRLSPAGPEIPKDLNLKMPKRDGKSAMEQTWSEEKMPEPEFVDEKEEDDERGTDEEQSETGADESKADDSASPAGQTDAGSAKGEGL